MTPDLIQEIRKQYNDLVEAMESEGVCVKRDCMYDTLRYDRRSGFHLCQKCEEIMEGWMPLPETEPPAGPVLLVVIARTVQHMPALWDGTEWTWLNADDADDPISEDRMQC